MMCAAIAVNISAERAQSILPLGAVWQPARIAAAPTVSSGWHAHRTTLRLSFTSISVEPDEFLAVDGKVAHLPTIIMSQALILEANLF